MCKRMLPTLPPPFLRVSFRAKKMELNLDAAHRQRDPFVFSGTEIVPATLL